MQITVLASIKDVQHQQLIDQTVIVIDVLRATSNMVTALSAGCREIIPLESIEAAINLRQPGGFVRRGA